MKRDELGSVGYKFNFRKGGSLNGHFQIRGNDDIRDILLKSCEGLVDLSLAVNRVKVLPCKELSDLILDEQERNMEVSQELKDLIHFILDAINTPVGKKPELAEVPEDEIIVREWEIFPGRPIIRRQVMYEQDRRNKTQITKRVAEYGNLNEAKNSEKSEFEVVGISCVNDHDAKRGVTPGTSIKYNVQIKTYYFSYRHIY